MKKLVLTALFASSIIVVSCQKKEAAIEEKITTETETTVDPASQTQTITTTTETTLEVPNFTSPDLQRYAKEYTAHMKQTIDAVKSGDNAKLSELEAKDAEWNRRGTEAQSNITAEDAKLWKEYQAKLSEQLATARK